MAKLAGIAGEYAGKTAPLSAGQVTVGRGPGCTLQFRGDPTVSTLHCTLYSERGLWYVVDHKSVNGTYLDGRRVGLSPVRMIHGSVLEVGDQKLRFDSEAVMKPPQVTPPPIQKLPAPPVLVETRPSGEAFGEGAKWHGVGEKVVISGLVIADPLCYIGPWLIRPPRPEDPEYPRGAAGEDPSLINPLLPTLGATQYNRYTSPSSNYARLAPSERLRHLKWLARSPRKGQDLTSARLQIMAFERFILEPPQEVKDDDLRAVLSVLNYLKVNAGVRSQCLNLQLHVLLRRPDLFDPLYLQRLPPPYASPDEWAVPLAILALRGEKVSDLVAGFLLSSAWDRITPFLPRERCPFELRDNFELLFQEAHPHGIDLEVSAKARPFAYVPLNDLLIKSPQSAIHPRLGVTNAADIYRRIVSLGSTAAAQLEVFARSIVTRTGQRVEYGEAPPNWAALPRVLKIKHGWIDSLRSRLAQKEVWSFEDLAAVSGVPFGGSAAPKVRASIAMAGFAMEPDPVLGTGKPKSEVWVRRMVEGAAVEPNKEVEGFLVMAQIGASLCHGTREGGLALMEGLASFFSISGPERERLAFSCDWLAANPPKVNKLVFQRVPARRRSQFQEVLLAWATRNGPPSAAQTHFLAKAWDHLQYDEKDLFSRLSSPRAPRPRSGPATAVVDPVALEAKRRETQQASALLSEVFQEEEAPAPQEPPRRSEDKVLSLILRLSPGEMGAEDFRTLCQEMGLLPSQAYDAVNERALDEAGDNVLYGEDPIEVDGEVLAILLP
jgi:hypothetical protein